MRIRTATLAALLLVVTASARAQEPDRWRGLVLGESSPAAAVKALGVPEKDSTRDKFIAYPLDKRLATKNKQFRGLLYKNLPGVKMAELVFTDGKLVSIMLQLEKSIEAAALENIYRVKFEPKFDRLETSLNSRNYERDKGRLYAKDYPVVYYLISKTERSYISAMVENGSFFGSNRGSTGEGAFPGKSKFIQLISLTLENREGADVLK